MDDKPNSKETPADAKRPASQADVKDAKAAGSETGAPPKKQLTPEEQMALYEDDLKENDWGHQPC